MAGIIQIITLILLSLLMISSSCDKGSEGCTDSDACNYDDTAGVDDNSCMYDVVKDCAGVCGGNAVEDCNGLCGGGSIIDCLGICDTDQTNDPPVDSEGHCCTSLDEDCDEIVVGGCIEADNCNYNSNANYDDGSCAENLIIFGGYSDGKDCNSDCGGTAVMDGCDLCLGGITNYGKCWQIEIKSIATFKLQDGTSMGSDTNSITIGATINALDGYNGEVIDDNNINCERNYLDFPEPENSAFPNEQNYIRFFIPHEGDDGWVEWWGSHYNFDRDIRSNDYHSLFTEEKGMNWFSVIEPTLSDTVMIDSIKFQVTHLEGIQCSDIKFYLDRERGETDGGIEIEDFELGIEVDTDKEINITINVSNICIREHEFDESCPDN
jgi:hypothetical protein